MSVNVLLENNIPVLINKDEIFSLIISDVSFRIESGNGYPGLGGQYHGKIGIVYISKYRAVYIESSNANSSFQSFSIPFYSLSEWEFRHTRFGSDIWKGVLDVVPNGGLIGPNGWFSMEFLNKNLSNVIRHVESYINESFILREQVLKTVQLTKNYQMGVAVLIEKNNENPQEIAFYHSSDPFTVYTCKKENK